MDLCCSTQGSLRAGCETQRVGTLAWVDDPSPLTCRTLAQNIMDRLSVRISIYFIHPIKVFLSAFFHVAHVAVPVASPSLALSPLTGRRPSMLSRQEAWQHRSRTAIAHVILLTHQEPIISKVPQGFFDGV